MRTQRYMLTSSSDISVGEDDVNDVTAMYRGSPLVRGLQETGSEERVEKALKAVSMDCRMSGWGRTDRLREDQAVKLVYSTPRTPNPQGDVWSGALEEGRKDMGLNVSGRRGIVVHGGWPGLKGYLLTRYRRDPEHSMAYSQPRPRLSVLSNSSVDHLSSSTRYSLPSASSVLVSPRPPRSSIYDRNLNKTRIADVSASSFSFLFSEIVQYTQKRVSGINDLERRYSHPHPTSRCPLISYPGLTH